MNNERSLAKEITEGFEALKSMRNNEPVAWINKRTSKCVVFINTPPSDDWIPLYTHPAKKHDLGISHAIGFHDGFKAGMQRAVEIGTYKSQNDNQIDTYKYKNLTDAEIEQILKQHDWYSKTWVDMVRSIESAILKKAQEK